MSKKATTVEMSTVVAYFRELLRKVEAFEHQIPYHVLDAKQYLPLVKSPPFVIDRVEEDNIFVATIVHGIVKAKDVRICTSIDSECCAPELVYIERGDARVELYGPNEIVCLDKILEAGALDENHAWREVERVCHPKKFHRMRVKDRQLFRELNDALGDALRDTERDR